MDQLVTMAPDGRLVIPARLRAQLGLEAGRTFLARVDGGGVRLVPLREVMGRVQANVPRYVPAGTDLSGELSRDRRRDAAAELSEPPGRMAPGEEVDMAKHDKPDARGVRVDERAPRQPGIASGRLPDAFFEPLPAAELAPWEGRSPTKGYEGLRPEPR